MKQVKNLTDAEWAIINAIWQCEPCGAPEIQQKLFARTSWTYSTVRTLMDRMVGKGLLAAEKVRHETVYRSVLKRREAQQRQVLSTLKQAFNGALTPMLQCLIDTGKLSTRELDEIEALIKARKQDGRK
jgi:BlaI family transcriptional regulator, penicillinase repressor